jgi:methylenetetrahydrofolate reductase (NADPH)
MKLHADPTGFDACLRHLLSTATIEVIPHNGAEDKVLAVPAGAAVNITCSSRFGLQRTIDLVASARANGYNVVPHLAARMIESDRDLRDFVHRIVDLGVTDLHVVGGDANKPVGRFLDTESILIALNEFDHGLTRLGVECHPEGLPDILDRDLTEALRRQQEHADYMVSQVCFDSATLVAWLRQIRTAGVNLPLRVGLASPLKMAKLAELSMSIGFGQTLRSLAKQTGMLRNLALGRTYAPEQFLTDIGPALLSPDLRIEGIHLFSFNQIGSTVQWQLTENRRTTKRRYALVATAVQTRRRLAESAITLDPRLSCRAR